MTRLNKASGNDDTPEWMFDASDIISINVISPEEAKKISDMPDTLNDDQVFEEMDAIECCAASGKPYRYSMRWQESAISRLREYACVCGIGDKFVAVDPQDDKIKSFASESPDCNQEGFSANNDPLLSAALSVKAKEHGVDFSSVIGDPFKLDEKGDDSYLNKNDWQEVKSASYMERGNGAIPINASVVAPMGGEYDYRKSTGYIRPGENSITDPDAIGKLAKEEDTGERLRRQNKQHLQERKAEKGAWEKEMVQKAKDMGPGSASRGSVFMTAAMDAQPGLRDSAVQQGVFQAKLAEMPDKTAGERLKSSVDDRRKSIQRPKTDGASWERVAGSTRAEVSDDFADALEQKLNEIN